MTFPMHSSSKAGDAILSLMSCAAAELTPNGLRISCAIPPMTMPSAASFSPWRICASMARCSTRLRPTTTTPVTSPVLPVIRDRRQDTGYAFSALTVHRPLDRSAIVDLGDPTKASFHLEVLWFFDVVREFGAAHLEMRIARGFLRRGVPSHDGPARIGGDDEVSRAVDDAGQMKLHPPHFLSELQQVGHIVHHQDRPARSRRAAAADRCCRNRHATKRRAPDRSFADGATSGR